MQKKRLLGILMVVLVWSLLVASTTTAQSAVAEGLPTLQELDEGWNTLSPAGETTCAYGTDFSFHVRPAKSDNLLIFLNGGGACWFGQICNPASPTFIPFANLGHNATVEQVGIFDLENAENPFSDYAMVFVPYCTGDVHLGNSVTEYPLGNQTITVAHNGYHNVMSVMNWVFENFESPELVFVTGSSAGSIPSPFYAGIVAQQYPDARIVQLGDGSGGYRSPEGIVAVNTAWNVLSILPDWEEFEGAAVETLTFESYYSAVAARFPNITFAQYNTAHDETQYQFLAILGLVGVDLLELLSANYDDIRADVPNFYTYTAGGALHTILRLKEFYTYEVNGVRVRDWVANLVAGEDVGDVLCDDCRNAPSGD